MKVKKLIFTDDIMPVRLDKYESCLVDYIKRVSGFGELDSIYQIGNISMPGISDLDLLLVMKDVRIKEAGEYAISNTGKESRYIFMHDPFIADTDIFRNTPFLYFISRNKKVWGRDLEWPRLDNEQTQIFGLLIIIETMAPNALGLLERVNSSHIFSRASLATFSSMVHTLNMVSGITHQMPERWSSFIQKTNDLKNGWFTELNSERKADQVRGLLLQELELTFEVLLTIRDFLYEKGYIAKEKDLSERTYVLSAGHPSKHFVFRGCRDASYYFEKSLRFSGDYLNIPMVPERIRKRYVVFLPEIFSYIFEFYSRSQGIMGSSIRNNFWLKPSVSVYDTITSLSLKKCMEKKISLLDAHCAYLKKNNFNFGLWTLARYYPLSLKPARKYMHFVRNKVISTLNAGLRAELTGPFKEDGLVKDLANWVMASGICSSIEGSCKGGVYLQFNAKKGRGSILHTEITAYGSLLFVNLFRWYKDKDYFDYALGCADFILRMQDASGGFSFGIDEKKGKSNEVFSFDAGICILALLSLYSITKAKQYLDAAEKAANWLISQAQLQDGSFKAVFDSNTNQFLVGRYIDDFWGDGSSLHAKLAFPLLKLQEINGDRKLASAAQKACDWVLGLQNGKGSFKTNSADSRIYTHVNCYVAEGLLYAYCSMQKEKYLESAKKLGIWLLEKQNEDGSLYWTYNEPGIKRMFIKRKATGPLAQAIRIWFILYYITKEEGFLFGAVKGGDFLRKSANYSSSVGKAYIPSFISDLPGWQGKSHNILTWTNFFSIQALYQLENMLRSNGLSGAIQELN